ncbi:cyclic nucleotide-binding domain-containing protein [Chloracidobacterium validum]|uniref:Cyclic nucleotide-binding domain-containing protein n=1 Tax=Chloracidobacterium validum TaxID=2821543 RepID=A0ABX8B8J6_9BACT|nr:cyclic nucleotide-binding domain-containing protein [Chloracidobacterium validum]QUW02376.1 cyclic nucleotide-binding domain-containing protein [Chloracidobacterium validum]
MSATATAAVTPAKRQEIVNRHAILEAIRGISAIEELVEHEPGHGYKFGVDLEVAIYGRNYGPGKKVGPYIRMYDYPPGLEIVHQGDWDTNTFYIIVSGAAEVFVAGVTNPVATFEPGKPFGEMGVLAGVPRSATVIAHRQRGARVLEVQRPALRVLRKLKKFGAALDITYRNNGRAAAANQLQISDDLKQKIAEIAEFRLVARGHVLASEAEPVHNLVIIRDGWVKRIGQAQQGETADYLGPGYILGFNALTTRGARFPYRAVAMSRTELLEVPVEALYRDQQLLEGVKAALGAAGDIGTPLQPTKALAFNPAVKAAQERILDRGLADANNLLLMDMDLCIRCGNCSLACHEIHGHSRLKRTGIHVLRPQTPTHAKLDQSLLMPAVCLHCKDPECLTGCPTGAIARFEGGQVDIIPSLCIGCSDCATQCPYNAISLIPRSELKKSTPTKAAPAKVAAPSKNGKSAPTKDTDASHEAFDPLAAFGLRFDPKPNPVTQGEDLVAIKCNLCNNTPLNPKDQTGKPVYATHKHNCEENCPTGALKRVKPNQYFNEIAQIHGPAFRRVGEMIVGNRFGHADRAKTLAHVLGVTLTLLLCGATMAGIVQYGLGTPLLRSDWFNFRWITGLVGLAGIIIVMLYPVRRQMWRRRGGALKTWMLSHTYAGVIAGIVLLLHGGTNLGGAVTAALMISFDLVILTGLIGILLYQIGPRLLTKIEGEPLLAEDLMRRRSELYREIADLTVTAQEQAEKEGRGAQFAQTFLPARDRVIATLLSLGFLFRQYIRRESLDDLLADVRRRFDGTIAKQPHPNERDVMRQIVEAGATIRRIDALLYIHRALKIWLPPHVISTSVMLALLVVHILQVVYYLWR